jgi:hypothetical protein
MRGSLGIERRHNQRDSIHDININFSNTPSRSKNASTDQTTANSLVRPGSSASFLGETNEVPRRYSRGASQPRFLAILMRWRSRHSRQTQPRTYAALVPC